MTTKKRLSAYAPIFLTVGAILTIGLLSFGGMLAIVPSITAAMASLVLSVAYEGEIYFKNLKSALKKLLKVTYVERQLAKEFLLEQMTNQLEKDADGADCLKADSPQFFKDYFERLNQHASNKQKKQLGDMEKWFAEQLFHDKEDKTVYQDRLYQELSKLQSTWQSDLQEKLHERQWRFQAFKLFCALAAVCMGVGTSFLLVETFAVIPWLAALSPTLVPILIVPMSVIAGLAYGLLTYNAMTDMLASPQINRWLVKIREDVHEGQYIMPVVLGIMLSLSVALSVCTAGTWWTVAKTTKPLFVWMSHIPSFVMFRLGPLILSLSTFVFNAQNIIETLEMADETLNPEAPIPARAVRPVLQQRNSRDEHWLQALNPFRFLVRVTFYPLLFVLFIGHLISISVMADRVPGISPFWSSVLGFANEGVEDAHYFSDLFYAIYAYFSGQEGHTHRHDAKTLLKERLGGQAGHNHDDDFPTRCVKALFHVLYVPAAAWDAVFSQLNTDEDDVLDFWTALDKQRGKLYQSAAQEGCCGVPHPQSRPNQFQSLPDTFCLPAVGDSPWAIEHTDFYIERYKTKKLQPVAGDDRLNDERNTERQKLSDLQQSLRNHSRADGGKRGIQLTSFISNAPQRFFATTQGFLTEDLPSRVGLSP
jgi:hypothetical protein